MNDVDQLVDVIRQLQLIKYDVHEMLETPVQDRDDLFYKKIEHFSEQFERLEEDRRKLIARIDSGEQFAAWLASRF